MLIYRELLVSKNPGSVIKHPDALLKAKWTALAVPINLVDGGLHSGTDATLLRICRKVYQEALGILYTENVFSFESPEAIYSFRDQWLGKPPRR